MALSEEDLARDFLIQSEQAIMDKPPEIPQRKRLDKSAFRKSHAELWYDGILILVIPLKNLVNQHYLFPIQSYKQIGKHWKIEIELLLLLYKNQIDFHI